MVHRPGVSMWCTGQGVDAAHRPGALMRGVVCGRGRHWRGQERQEETPSDLCLGAREGVAVDRVWRGGALTTKKETPPSRA